MVEIPSQSYANVKAFFSPICVRDAAIVMPICTKTYTRGDDDDKNQIE